MVTVYSNVQDQLKQWREVNAWIQKHFAANAIPEAAFSEIAGRLTGVNEKARLFYGFGDDGQGGADPLHTGHIFVTYLTQRHAPERSRFVDFYPPPPAPAVFDFYRPIIKMREGAANRPQGFYIKELLAKDLEAGIGAAYKHLSPADVRKLSPWGWGPEGFQFLAIEEAYVPLLVDGKVPIFVLGDYSVSPYGTDYSSTILLGTARGRLEIGTTNTRDNIPKYAPSHLI